MSQTEEEINNDSGTESDSSIGTDELNDLQSSLKNEFQEAEEPIEEPVEPIKKQVKTKSKNIKKPEKKKKGRPPKPIEEKLARQVIKKEKIVYVIQGEDGKLTRKDPSNLGIRDLRKLKIEDEAQKAELEYGKKLGRLKNGKAKIPKTRTEAQKKATEKMLEANRLRRAGKKSESKQERKEEIKEVVKESVKEVVQEPAVPKPPPEIKPRFNFFG
tara:strand:+ start:7050 stop:7694 length:645 start_codon:yes stop_codon:yes gene_type:complete